MACGGAGRRRDIRGVRRARRCGVGIRCAPAPGALKINEIESSDPSLKDYVELINNGSTAGDIGGYIVKDNDNAHVFTVPAGTSIAAGGYYVATVDAGGSAFGLGSSDSARLFAPGGTTLLDSYNWTSHRCDATVTRVTKGDVRVRDRSARRSVKLHGPRRYVAPARRKPIGAGRGSSGLAGSSPAGSSSL